MNVSTSELPQATWTPKVIKEKLDGLAGLRFDSRSHTYINPDLSLGTPPDSFFSKATHFFGFHQQPHEFNYHKARQTLMGLRPQILTTHDHVLIDLFEKAVVGFNKRAPRYKIVFEEGKEITLKSRSLTATSKSYLTLGERSFPKVLGRTPKSYYPNQFLSWPTCKQDERGNPVATQLIQRDAVALKYKYEALTDLRSYETAFNDYLLQYFNDLAIQNGVWDLHDIHFQTLALRLTAPFTDEELRNPPSKAHLQLVRARNFAIGSRPVIGWKGEALTSAGEQRKKVKEMAANWNSLVLRDWGGIDHEFLSHPQIRGHEQQLTVTDEDTQSAVERLAKRYHPSIIAWVNMATAHEVAGGYQSLKETQEEIVTTHSDAMVTLSNLGKRDDEDGQVYYDRRLHIPPGGNYFHKMRFLTGDRVCCQSIVHSFANFREWGYEWDDFVGKDGALDITSEAYLARIKLDMRGVLRTAIAENQRVLVLGATGCGTLGHDPVVESKAWKAVLEEALFKNHFYEVVFAIKEKRKKSNNLTAFQATFKKEE